MKRSSFALALLASASALPVVAAADDGGVPDTRQTLEAARGVDFAADQITYDRDSDVVTAEGNIILHHRNMVFHADRVIYDRATGIVQVKGDLWARDEDGNVLTATQMELRDDFSEGMMENIGFILSDESRFAARSAVRREDRTTTLDRAVYSPCRVCPDDPTPLWRIRAVEVVHDQDEKRIRYRNATLDFVGVPVLYTPYLSHPDPSVHAASGLLAPKLSRSKELGAMVHVPYYFSLAPHRDLTVEPIITAKEGVVLASEYREHIGNGQFDIACSVTYTDKRDDFGVKPGGQEFRGHLFSTGQFDIGGLQRLGGEWQFNYDAGLASDDTYLRRYEISDTDTITSRAAVERFGNRSYGALTVLTFQGLRIEDDWGTTPHALPRFDYHYKSAPGLFGGRYRVDMNALALQRFDGMDSRRVSVDGGWEAPFVAPSGSIYEFSVSLRGDMYHVNGSANPDEPVYAGENGFEYRVLPRARLSWRMPMVKHGTSTTQTMEPIVALVAGLKGGNPDALPNEDSRIVGFDDTNLFANNRFTGIDRWEGGSRVDYGLRYGVDTGGIHLRALAGQSYRFTRDEDIPAGTGLDGRFSDFVTRVEVNLSPYLDVIHRMRLDSSNLAVRRNEADVVIGPPSFRVTAGYIDLKSGADNFDGVTPLTPREEVRGGATWRITNHWTLAGSHTRSLDRGEAVATRIGLIYEDECLRFGVAYDQRFTRDRDIEPGTSIIFTISLANLG
ncbi:MAG: LPS assembly protein LptD [Sphingomonadales bacterium]